MAADGFVKMIEGMTALLVPQSSLSAKVPPKAPAFFNPIAKLTRDLSILAYRVFSPGLPIKTFADSFTGIGARALRVAVEVPEIQEVYGNDINGIAIDVAKEAAKLNSVGDKCYFSAYQVCKFLHNGANCNERFGIVDLDPFGTPAKYIDCVLRAVTHGGLVSITATDTAVLCGIYPKVCVRRYYGRPLNNSYGNETAVRLLLSLLALTASRLELGIRPLFAHATLHYLRVYVTVSVSSSQANEVYRNIGFVKHCFQCGHRFKVDEYDSTTKCELCNSALSIGGQLWTGFLHNKDFVTKMEEQSKDKHCKKVLATSIEEISDIPYYFRADEISARLKKSPQSVQKIVDKLQSTGFQASRTALNPGSFKTDARIDRIMDILK